MREPQTTGPGKPRAPEAFTLDDPDLENYFFPRAGTVRYDRHNRLHEAKYDKTLQAPEVVNLVSGRRRS